METKIKERPILFSGEMVRAILEGRKTQTRRVVTFTASGRIKEPGSPRNWHLDDPEAVNGCPYGKPGDRIYVRETWWQAGEWSQSHPEDDEWSLWIGSRRVIYAADRNPPNEPNRHYPVGLRNGRFSAAEPNRLWRKRPSIHMPRWASRILLEITDVRVERLQDISEEDALAEGVKKWPHKGHFAYGYDGGYAPGYGSHSGAFCNLWDSINAKRGYSWESNPWVWVIEFKRIEP